MKLFLIGGFLGSGKTTAIQQASTLLIKAGTKVGVITNDQGEQLIDTAFIKGYEIPALEVTGGCFCCNYSSLDGNIEAMIKTHDPEIVFAESVGSCTDLVATVVKPLQHFRPGIEVVLSVFADARVLPLLIKGSRLFADSVNYIYKKQLEEADVIVVNKVDTLTAHQLEEIKQLVQTTYPRKTILLQDSLNQDSVKQWLEILNNFQTVSRKSLELNYEIYGAGEAELAWFDAEVEIVSPAKNAFSAANKLVKKIYLELQASKMQIGHLKFLVKNEKGQYKISFTSASKQDFTPVFNGLVSEKVVVFINARVQTTPGQLKKLISDAIAETQRQDGFKVTEKKTAVFKPGYPKPTHRIVDHSCEPI